jgi:hypothetical protein
MTNNNHLDTNLEVYEATICALFTACSRKMGCTILYRLNARLRLCKGASGTVGNFH